jgi:hypothetical protein
VIQWLMAKKRVLLLGLALASTAQAQEQKAIGEVFSGDARVRGSVVLTAQGTHVMSGSQVSAGEGAALLKLARGGQVRICPRTNLSLSSDASGRSLSLGLDTGSMELDYTLTGAADSLMTPDFRLQLISPGSFHLAISVRPSGDTCLRSLAGNDAAVFVAEMMGNDSYQLSPGKNVLFVGGKISGATQAPEVCGCPEIRLPERRAPPTEVAAAVSEAPSLKAPPADAPPATLPATAAAGPAAESPAKAEQATEAHMEVDSGFLYRGDAAAQDIYGSVSRLSLSTDSSKLALALLPQVSGPAAIPVTPEKKTGFMHWLGRLFSR